MSTVFADDALAGIRLAMDADFFWIYGLDWNRIEFCRTR